MRYAFDCFETISRLQVHREKLDFPRSLVYPCFEQSYCDYHFIHIHAALMPKCSSSCYLLDQTNRTLAMHFLILSWNRAHDVS